MGSITTKQIELMYEFAKRNYRGLANREAEIRDFTQRYGINVNSLKDYINCFSAMMDGKVYKRTINKEATKYYFKRILEEYGQEQLNKALDATQQHVDYYYEHRNDQLKSIRALILQYR